MHEAKIAEYRTEAAKCIAQAEQQTNSAPALRWRKLAEEWTRMAHELGHRDNPQN